MTDFWDGMEVDVLATSGVRMGASAGSWEEMKVVETAKGAVE